MIRFVFVKSLWSSQLVVGLFTWRILYIQLYGDKSKLICILTRHRDHSIDIIIIIIIIIISRLPSLIRASFVVLIYFLSLFSLRRWPFGILWSL